jgi:hypothetical protein
MNPSPHVNVVFFCLLAVGVAFAAPNRQPDYLPKPYESVNWSGKRIDFEKRNQPWREVLDWFAQQTRLSYVSKYAQPTGILSFDPPNDENGKPRKYTLVEIFDILNEGLIIEHRLILVRGEKTLTMFSADEMIPIPRVRLKDLPGRGRTEVVMIVVTMDPETVPNVKRAMGTFGTISPLENGQVMLQGPVASVMRAVSRAPMTDAP